MDTGLNMHKKNCLVTGATSGIGFATAQKLAAMGATVIIHGRNSRKAQQTVEIIKKETGKPSISYLLADLTSLSQIRDMAEELRRRFDRLDVLINNAGAIFLRREISEDGFEKTFALNHLAPFLLTHLLQPVLSESQPARVINVNSVAHKFSRLDFDDLQCKNNYNGMKAYARAKLANMLFTLEMANRIPAREITTNALHPGYVNTGFGSNNGSLATLAMRLGSFLTISPEKAAQTCVYLAVSPQVKDISGGYFSLTRAAHPSPQALDREAASRLWKISQTLITV